MLVSASLIVKDEEAALPGCLLAVAPLVDEIVVYDTGSTDRTVALARDAGAVVIEGHWTDDFAAARNSCLEHCRGEWVLCVDADDIALADPATLRAELEAASATGIDALSVVIEHLAADGRSVAMAQRFPRLFRPSRLRWEGRLHEQPVLRPGEAGPSPVAPSRAVRLRHSGHRRDAVRAPGRDKVQRNLSLAQAEFDAREAAGGADAHVTLNLARSLVWAERTADALELFERATTLAGSGPLARAAWTGLARALVELGRYDEAIAACAGLRAASTGGTMADFLEGQALRRAGRPLEALQLLGSLGELIDEDGNALPAAALDLETGGALLDAGQPAAAIQRLRPCLSQVAAPGLLAALAAALTACGRPPAEIAGWVGPEAVEPLIAGLHVLPPAQADEVCDALFTRFGSHPACLAAAARFAPALPLGRALEWSARLRSAGAASLCPLLSTAGEATQPARRRLLAAAIATAAFADDRAPVAAAGALAELDGAEREAALVEVQAVAPGLAEALRVTAC